MINRVVSVLETFSATERSMTASEIGRRAGLPIPTAHRIVGDLVRTGLLERDESGSVRIGIRLWELVMRSTGAFSLRDIALPFMEDLHAAVRQHVQLSVLDDHDVLYLEVLVSRHSGATIVTKPGVRLPAMACAPGIVLAAFSDPGLQEELLALDLTTFTSQTPVDRDWLRAEIEKARASAYALASGWIHPETSGLAVPILLPDGKAVAALSLSTGKGVAEELALLAALTMTSKVIGRALRMESKMVDPGLNLLRQQLRDATGRG
jgi:DNA-binding IclR family transcriptional regulator